MKLTHRQFQDIQTLASRVLEGDHFDTDIETFSRFSEQFRHWIYDFTDDYRVVERLEKIPFIEVQKEQSSFWDAVPGISPFRMYNKYRDREGIKAKVKEAASLFNAIYFLLQDELDEFV
ncbi:MAG TPA: hypothetical protein PKA00_12320 [Saprospiraceae bacterium]|nr:hypothetical protein [Saprospiraceae bacterium]HMQ83692.1 hypothetical protein [Saprospiraceae bacterium]